MNPPETRLESLIHVVRGRRVMLDSDLARIYQVSTKRLNEQVRRNPRRFPDDFMLALTKDEAASLRSQTATLEGRGKHRKYTPLAFTEQGVAMLSSVLRTERAVEANVAIMRAFVRYQDTLVLNRDLALKFRELASRVDRHDGEIGAILDAIRRLIAAPTRPRRRIGFTSARCPRDGRN